MLLRRRSRPGRCSLSRYHIIAAPGRRGAGSYNIAAKVPEKTGYGTRYFSASRKNQSGYAGEQITGTPGPVVALTPQALNRLSLNNRSHPDDGDQPGDVDGLGQVDIEAGFERVLSVARLPPAGDGY